MSHFGSRCGGFLLAPVKRYCYYLNSLPARHWQRVAPIGGNGSSHLASSGLRGGARESSKNR
eukprot:12078895-Heterocapsa_arctica.AAC.1